VACGLALGVVAAVITLPACGKKGPPLAPLITLPKAPEEVLGRRFGATVYLQFRVPRANGDNSAPADIERVDVYGFTGTPTTDADIYKEGTLVASVPVRKPPDPDEDRPKRKDDTGKAPRDAKPATPAAPPRPPASLENGFDQGDTIVVTEPIGAAQLTPVVLKKKPVVVAAVPDVAPPLGPPPPGALLSRVYVAIGINHRGRKGQPSERVSIPLFAPSSAPSAPTITYSESDVKVAWAPPPDLRLPIQQLTADNVLDSTTIGMGSTPGAFNVYDVPPPASSPTAVKLPSPPPAGGAMPRPLNDAPVTVSPFVDPRVEFGKPRCYVVRTVSRVGLLSVESEASPVTCVTLVDTFPPAAPRALAAVASGGAISLIWEANTERDLDGYLVLRAEAGRGDPTPIIQAPIKESTYRDATVKTGVRYVYVVVAVDTSKNQSAPSNRVEELAR
jgi:hypothetical protein